MIWNHPSGTTIKNWLFGVPGINIFILVGCQFGQYITNILVLESTRKQLANNKFWLPTAQKSHVHLKIGLPKRKLIFQA